MKLAFADDDVFLPGQPSASGPTPLGGPPTDKPQVAETKFSLEESDKRHQSDTEHHQSDATAQLSRFQIPKDYSELLAMLSV